MESREALLDMLADCLSLMRAVIDSGACKNVAHLRDGGDVLREDLHFMIQRVRVVLNAEEASDNDSL